VGLMDGLSHWLRQIIAVVLLASLIDLLLPNRTMQRYVRLVAGLFILMTVATPIMHWMKGNFSTQLAAGLDSVLQTPTGAADQLAMIEQEGAKLRDKQSSQAADLVATRLEAAIRSEVEQSENRNVSKVDVVTERGIDGSLTVSKVIVLLASGQDNEERSQSTDPVKEVGPIAAVDIRIEVEEWPEATKLDSPSADPTVATAEATDADQVTRTRVSTLIATRFGLSAGIVEVKQLVLEASNSN
jgi:stage III sporulation protein AF